MLIPSNGNYGLRMTRLAREAGRVPVVLDIPEGEAVSAGAVAKALAEDPSIGVVSIVHSETATALINPVEEIAAVVRAAGRRLIVDAVSGFGAIPFDLAAHPETDAVVFSSNKCLEAMPGIGFAEWGPGDMGLSMGHPGQHDPPYPPDMLAARSRVLAACRAARIALRLTLLQSGVEAARGGPFAFEPGGKPFIAGGPAFSLSHSDELALIAVADPAP